MSFNLADIYGIDPDPNAPKDCWRHFVPGIVGAVWLKDHYRRFHKAEAIPIYNEKRDNGNEKSQRR